MSLSISDAIYITKVYENYFGNIEGIEQYMREQKLESINGITSSLFPPEDELFSNFTIHPNEMEFDVVQIPNKQWNTLVDITSSHINKDPPARNYKLAVIEKKTQKYVGFIRLGSPIINCKPRNDMLGQVFTQQKEWSKRFNETTLMGFVIVPAQPFGYNYLGGKLLAAICCSHKVRELCNEKYNMNMCLFETTSLYGSSKTVSQYDGMKPYLRFKGLTESDFLPLMHGKPYNDLVEFVENRCGELIEKNASSRKLKISQKIISLTKQTLKGTDELKKLNEIIESAKSLTEKKRYYTSNYGFSNYIDYINCKTDTLIKDPENYDKFEFENVIEWWRKKAVNRYENLKNDGKLRTEIEVWTSGKDIDIIR